MGKYIDYPGLYEDAEKIIDFIEEDLGVRKYSDIEYLLRMCLYIIQPDDESDKELPDPEYIG